MDKKLQKKRWDITFIFENKEEQDLFKKELSLIYLNKPFFEDLFIKIKENKKFTTKDIPKIVENMVDINIQTPLFLQFKEYLLFTLN